MQHNVISFLGRVLGWYRELPGEVNLLEEPSELIFLNDNRELANDIVNLAFQYAHAQASLLEKTTAGESAPAAKAGSGASTAVTPASMPELFQQTRDTISQDQARIAQLNAVLRRAPVAERLRLTSQLMAVKADLEWQQARASYISTLNEFERANGGGQNALQDQIDELQQSLPPASRLTKLQPAAFSAPLQTTGLIGQIRVLLQNQSRLQMLDQRMDTTRGVGKWVERLRSPLRAQFLALDAQAQSLAQAALGSDVQEIQQRQKAFQNLIVQRRLLAAAMMPLSEETVMLARYTANLAQWRGSVIRHSAAALHSLLMRLGAILFLLALIFVLAMAWRQLVLRYVEDVNRRRQLLKVRNAIVIFLLALVLLFNFTTELAALATVVGFAAAGIVVALQDVFLSLAGYFRLSGRYGMRRGDQVEVMGVRGEVLEIGLTKLTLIEYGSDSPQSGLTGRLVVIPNSSVFRDKFVNHPPESRLLWRELNFTISLDCDYRMVERRLLQVVDEVIERYRDKTHHQFLAMERTLSASLESPRPVSRLRLRSQGLEITLRYPVEVTYEAQVADEITRRLLDNFSRPPVLRFVSDVIPNIQPAAGEASVTAQAGASDLPKA
jgi:small-conductance mechanosensitive channel